MDTLVMIPGLGSDHAVWDRTISALGGAFACQMGDTHRDDSLEGMARRILSAAPERFHLAGVSMGGMVAMEIMRLAPERVVTLALVDTNARPDTDEQKERRRMTNGVMAVADDLAPLGRGSLGYLIHPKAAADVGDALVAMTVRVGAQTYIRQNTAVMERGDQRPILPGIAIPTAVIVGAEDLMTSPELSEEIHAAIPGAELHVIPDCGHLPPIEKPDAMAMLLKALARRAI